MTTVLPSSSFAIVDEKGIGTIPWLLFFASISTGDQGVTWTPNFTSLGSTGTPSFSGFYYQISSSLAYFSATITPATDTTATAGTTYINNFPLQLKRDGACHGVSGFTGSLAGICQASSNRIYVPGWSGITVPVTICGTVEAG